MGRPITKEDIEDLDLHFSEIGKLSNYYKFLVFLPSIVFTTWILYQYYTIFS